MERPRTRLYGVLSLLFAAAMLGLAALRCALGERLGWLDVGLLPVVLLFAYLYLAGHPPAARPPEARVPRLLYGAGTIGVGVTGGLGFVVDAPAQWWPWLLGGGALSLALLVAGLVGLQRLQRV